jgi:hypothetical protein
MMAIIARKFWLLRFKQNPVERKLLSENNELEMRISIKVPVSETTYKLNTRSS